MQLKFPKTVLNLDYPHVMGILNVTPDSFSDGGQYSALDAAVQQAKRMLAAGASIIDIGGESTRPGAASVSEQEERQRVVPVIDALVKAIPDIIISVDTSKPAVMRAAVNAGAQMINDVNALQAPDALSVAAELNVPVCLMHMQGQPRTMQNNPTYQNVVDDVKNFFENRLSACKTAGIDKHSVVLDPGFGFGKTVQHNLELLKQLATFHVLDCPLLVGVSRKSMIGAVLDKTVDERMLGSVVAATMAATYGAHIIRVHDVAETADAMRVVRAVQQGITFNE